MTIAAIIGAVWLGILTSISPCPLATNIAAVSYLSRGIGDKRRVVLSALLYTVGRMAAYTAVAFAVVESLLAIPTVSIWLQINMPKMLGPLLIVVGMFLVELISVSLPGAKKERDYGKFGHWGAVLMGFLFALAFCPVSAALFFGSLIPLALQQSSPIVLPLIYGVGTALPVIAFALLIAFGNAALSTTFNAVTRWEKRIRYVFGVIIIMVGVYLTLVHAFGIRLF